MNLLQLAGSAVKRLLHRRSPQWEHEEHIHRLCREHRAA